MKLYLQTILVGLLFSSTAFSEEKNQTIYEYKKYEKIDLGSLEVNGELLAPGDVSVAERDREKFVLDLYLRKN